MVDAPPWLLELFDMLNASHFDGLLPRPKLGVQNWLDHRAAYIPTVRMIWIHPRTAQQDRKYVADSLLHEMVHYALEVETGDHARDHGKVFVERANKIGKQLGLRSLAVGEAAVLEWPQSLRPADYAPWH